MVKSCSVIHRTCYSHVVWYASFLLLNCFLFGSGLFAADLLTSNLLVTHLLGDPSSIAPLFGAPLLLSYLEPPYCTSLVYYLTV